MTTDFPRNENLNDFSINRNFASKISERNDQENFASDTFYSNPFGENKNENSFLSDGRKFSTFDGFGPSPTWESMKF